MVILFEGSLSNASDAWIIIEGGELEIKFNGQLIQLNLHKMMNI